MDPVKFPVLVRNDYGEVWLLGSDRDPDGTFEVVDIENKEYVMWDSLGRGVTARNDERARRIVLEYDDRSDDAAALKAAILADAKRLGWMRDVQELLEKGVALTTVVRFMEWARKSKRGQDASSR